jgi:predicted NACHT family NTPase
VKQVRQKVRPSIEERCGTMRVLDMTQPIGLNEIYIDVNILETIASCRRKTIDDFWQGCTRKNFDRVGLGKVTEERVPGKTAVDKYSKLMVLGKPGAGKTTFLKHLAIECIGGDIQEHRVPIFITLKQFAETERKPHREDLTPPLDTYVHQMFTDCGVTTNEVEVEQLLRQGRALVLLDGLDEVRDSDYSTVLNRIRDFTQKFHANQFVMTCRIAAREYTFENFTDVEVADFDARQIAEFVNKWFDSKDKAKTEIFIEQLSANQPIKELATNPLLLTLLCSVFEKSAEFPSNRSELYKEGLDIMLKKWDAKRNIDRDSVYKKLSLQRKQDLLSSIALTTFERGEYFFKQQKLEQHIGEYIRNLPDAQNDEAAFQLDNEAVLKSIEAQHGLFVERSRGIYSFSHLTFQEYFTARKIVDSRPQALDTLANHITEPSWREVFLLTVGMMPQADELLLLMKQQADALIASDEELQQLMSWVSQKCDRVKVPYKPASVRAFYLVLFHVFYRAVARAFDPTRDSYTRTRRFILNLDRAGNLTEEEKQAAIAFDDIAFYLKPDIDPAYAIACILALDFEPELKQALQQLSVELPDSEQEEEIKNWKQANGEAWMEKLRAVMIENTNIEQDWHFRDEQINALQQYIYANHFLVECLHSDCHVTKDVRHKIENTLLLPILPFFSN